MSLRQLIACLWEGPIAVLQVAGAVGTLGIIVGTFTVTGLGLRFTSMVVDAANGQLLLTLIFVAIASWILGAGVTVTSSYIIVAILAAPALEVMGLPVLAAHLIIFWVSQDANVTPPVAVAAYAASGIAKSNPMRTSWEAWKLARGMYIVPFLIAYWGMVGGTPQDLVVSTIIGTLATLFFSFGMVGYFHERIPKVQRALLFGATVLIIIPDWRAVAAGFALGALVMFETVIRKRVTTTGKAGIKDEVHAG